MHNLNSALTVKNLLESLNKPSINTVVFRLLLWLLGLGRLQLILNVAGLVTVVVGKLRRNRVGTLELHTRVGAFVQLELRL